MTATGHALIGTVVAAKFANPAIGIPLCLLSHIAADSFPHWDTATNRLKKSKSKLIKESIFDVFLGFFLSFVVIKLFFPTTNLTYTFFCIIAAQFLDWSTAPYIFLNIKKFPFTMAYKIQKSFDHRLDKPWGIIWQVLAIGSLIFIAKVL